ncbi:hypothetical protein CYLTODRAFT_443305 [Cylindrobasidium torrendii FP15055 ss-10]|uniref:Uncharacterized protein n=1 Tax=Cylindrobasidium torrendii FP15055 ss-10 TaxID=1314674 RepID=A0A0D7BE99_9AGAR|nr:hypothetical protein CYLTODRAFT_443305 [Cylindrobasidium torrendii FP15055 ss-10]
MAKSAKASPTAPRNVSDPKTSHPLSSTIRKKLEGLSSFDQPAGFLTGKLDHDNIRQMCHGLRRSIPTQIVYCVRIICNENLHIDSTTNIFLVERTEGIPHPQHWRTFEPKEKNSLRKYLSRCASTYAPSSRARDLSSSISTQRPENGHLNQEQSIRTKRSASTPLMAWHPIWVFLQRVDVIIRLARSGVLHSIKRSPEQKELDEDMLEFCTSVDHNIFKPVTLAEYRDMVAQGWMKEDDVKNWLICRGSDREVPLYDPQTGDLVGPYLGLNKSWPVRVKPQDVQSLSGELDPSSDDAPSSDLGSEAESNSSQWDDLEEQVEMELKFKDITYDSDNDDDDDWHSQQPLSGLSQPTGYPAQSLNRSRSTASVRNSSASESDIPASIPVPEPLLAPAPAPAPKPPTPGRRLFHLPSPDPLAIPGAGSVDTIFGTPPSSPTPTARHVKKKARMSDQAGPDSRVSTNSKASTAPATPPPPCRRRRASLPTIATNNEPLSDSLQSPDPLDLPERFLIVAMLGSLPCAVSDTRIHLSLDFGMSGLSVVPSTWAPHAMISPYEGANVLFVTFSMLQSTYPIYMFHIFCEATHRTYCPLPKVWHQNFPPSRSST